MFRTAAVVAVLATSIASCTRRLTETEAGDASIEELRAARAAMTDLGNVDFGIDREPYAERLITQAGSKLGWPEEDTNRAAKGIAWKGMTRDQLWWSWGPAWKEIPPSDGVPETWEWGPWHLGEPRRAATLDGDVVTRVTVNPPPG